MHSYQFYQRKKERKNDFFGIIERTFELSTLYSVSAQKSSMLERFEFLIEAYYVNIENSVREIFSYIHTSVEI